MLRNASSLDGKGELRRRRRRGLTSGGGRKGVYRPGEMAATFAGDPENPLRSGGKKRGIIQKAAVRQGRWNAFSQCGKGKIALRESSQKGGGRNSDLGNCFPWKNILSYEKLILLEQKKDHLSRSER